MNKKRVGIVQAKKIFKQRSLKSRVTDRRHTSKKLVYPYSKNSYRWKQNPQQYDMVGVDTKTRVEEKIINGKLFVKYEKAKNLKQANRQEREILAFFSKKISVPQNMSTKQLKKVSAVQVETKKDKDNYALFIRAKKDVFVIPHPVFMQQKQRGKG